MRKVLSILVLLWAFAAPAHVLAQGAQIFVPATPEFPAVTGRVVDDAGVLDAATREALRAKLQSLEEKTGTQLIVATVKSLHGSAVEDYANRLFRRWRLGEKERNNGVLLLHAPNERKIRIEVGYGLEGTLTDAISKFILANAVAPRFKDNDFNGGMTRGVDDIIKVLSGDEEFKRRAGPTWHWPRLNLVPLIVLSLMVPLALFLLYRVVIGGWARRRSRNGSWHSVDSWTPAHASSGTWSSSSSSWSSSSSSGSSSSSDSFSGGGGGDSGGGGASSDY